MRINNTKRKKVATMTEGRMTSRVAKLLSDAVEVYQDKDIGEGALLITVILSALVDADRDYFESDTFRHHCDLLPDNNLITLDHGTLLEQIRKLYK